MIGGRSYGEGCAAAHALDLIGERWALLIVRELLLGPKRFTDLRAGVRNASANLLSQRLRELERAGVIRRRTLPPPAGSRVYELTEWGRDLEPLLVHLGRWGSRSPTLPHDAEMSVDSQILALKALFDRAAAHNLDARFELQLGTDSFRIEISNSQIAITRGSATNPDAIIETDRTTWSDLLWHGRRLADALRAGDIAIDGDQQAVARLLQLFPAPAPAAPPPGGQAQARPGAPR
jgi:DNA-binding HxlR family transcriptional regulator/putative sterol carrier protein